MEYGKSVLSKGSEEFLWKYIRERNLKNFTVNITPSIGPVDNYLSTIAQVDVKSENKKYRWVIKCAIEHEIIRYNLPLKLAFEREVYVYRKVLVEYQRFQEERGILTPFKSYAKFHSFSLTAPNECVLMENMNELGYVLQNRKRPLNYNHVLMVMKEYGRFHALSFALRDQKPSLFAEIAENTEEMYLNHIRQTDIAMFEILKRGDMAVNSLDPVAHNEIHQKMSKFKGQMHRAAQKVSKSTLSGKYSVVCHGDCWTNNILYKYLNPTERNSPSQLCFIDWQLSRLGSPVLDLSYFLFSNTSAEFREKYYDAMIKEYHKSLSAFLLELGSDPEKLFPFSVLKEHLKSFSLFGLYMTILIFYTLLNENGKIADVLEVPDYEEKMVSPNADLYNERIRGVLLDFDRFGYNLDVES